MSEERSTEQEIRDALSINEDDIANDLIDQPALYYYYACGWAIAAKQRRLSKIRLKEIEAELGREYKELVRSEDSKARVTERMLDDYLAEHPIYKESLTNLIQAEYKEAIFEVAKDAFKERYGVLIELSKSRGEEKFYANELSVMKKEMERRDKKVQGKRSKRTKEENNVQD